jgi:hypothetical protein
MNYRIVLIGLILATSHRGWGAGDDIIVLPPVVIRAERDKDPVTKREVTKEDLRLVPGTQGDPLKVLQSLPGVAVGSDGSSDPAVRGTAPVDNSYYIDFQTVGYLFHTGDLLSVLNGDLVDSFSIYPSAFGPEYNSALGAVIDVRLRDPRRDRWGSKLNLSAFESDVLVEGPVGSRQAVYGAARRSYLDFLLSKFPGTSDIDVVQFPEFYDYQGKWVWQNAAGHRLVFQTNGAWDKVALDIKSESDIAKRDPALAGRFAQTQDYHQEGLAWTWTGPSVTNAVALSHTQTVLDNRVGGLGVVRINNRWWDVRDDVAWRLPAGNTLSLGVHHIHVPVILNVDVKVDFPSEFDPPPDFTSAPPRSEFGTLYINETLGYLKDRWSPGPDVTLSAGGRWGRNGYLKENYGEPWAAGEWRFLENTTFSSAWGRYHQFPEGHQTTKNFGNPDLTALRAEHVVAGLQQKMTDGWSVNLELYRKRLWNLPVEDPVLNFVNGARGLARGVEFLVKKERTARWAGWFAVSQSHSTRLNERTGQKVNFSQDQPWVLNLVATRRVDQFYSVGLRAQYHSGAPDTPITGTFIDGTGRVRPVYGPTGSVRLPDYHRIDLRFSRDFKMKGGTGNFYLDLINVLNHKNVAGYSYSDDYSGREKVTQLPFFPSVGVQLSF